MPATARDRLRTPGDALATLQNRSNERVRLELLQQIVGRELDIAVVEPDHKPERDHVVAHRIEPGAAELAIARGLPQRPAKSVDDPAQRLRNLPHLLHTELPDLRLWAVESEVIESDAREVPRRALGKHRHLRNDVGAGFEVPELLAVAAAALVAAPNPNHAAVLDEKPIGRGLGKNEGAATLGLFSEIATHLRDRDDPVAVVSKRRRRRNP